MHKSTARRSSVAAPRLPTTYSPCVDSIGFTHSLREIPLTVLVLYASTHTIDLHPYTHYTTDAEITVALVM